MGQVISYSLASVAMYVFLGVASKVDHGFLGAMATTFKKGILSQAPIYVFLDRS